MYNIGNSESFEEAFNHAKNHGISLVNGAISFVESTGKNLISLGKIITFNGTEQDFRNAGTLTKRGYTPIHKLNRIIMIETLIFSLEPYTKG